MTDRHPWPLRTVTHLAVACALATALQTTGARRAVAEEPLTFRAHTGTIDISGWDRPDVKVEAREGARTSIVAHVPAHRTVDDVALHEGRVTLRNLRAGVRARVELGTIDASGLAGTVRLETRLGDIRLRDATLSADGMLRLRTFNGAITLGLAVAPRDARVLALTLDGEVHSTLPLTTRTTHGPRFAEATFGRGTPVVSIDAVRGDIHIRTEGR